MDGLDDTITFRPHTDEDLPFLLDSWGSSFFKANPEHEGLTPDEFHSFHRPRRQAFFQRPSTCVIVACPKDDPWVILGWIAVEQLASGIVLQYLYVKSAFKRQGIAQNLIKRAIKLESVIFTHLSERGSKIMGEKSHLFRNWRYIPHLF